MSSIKEISLKEIDAFPNHPFRVEQDEALLCLAESIRDNGLFSAAIVRKKEDGRYELISGHRRKLASELAGMETMKCEILDISQNEATILMVESNFQRQNILPSEKAFAYKMRMDAMKKKAGRHGKENEVPVGHNSSRNELAGMSADSSTQIYRYIRLTELVPELLEYVDSGKMKMRPAVELSYLDEERQRDVVDEIDLNETTPSYVQALKMKKEFQEGILTQERITDIFLEQKPNQEEKLILKRSVVRKLIPRTVKKRQFEDYIYKALEFYGLHSKNQKQSSDRMKF